MIQALYPRDDFNFDPHIRWFMHCAEGPVPLCSISAMRDFLHKEAKPWQVDFQRDFVEIPASVKDEAAKLIEQQPGDITLTTTTSAGLVLVAQGMSWQSGDEILIPTGEFPSNIWPWKSLENQGVIVREAPLWEGHRGGANALKTTPPRAGQSFEDCLLSAISPKTRLIAVSWVRFQDGLKLDLRHLVSGCKEKGIDLVVDGIQGAGTLPGIPKGISAFTTGAHKGLLTPQGSGFLWTSPEFRAKLKPMGSWLSVEGAMDFSRPNSDANRKWNTDGSYLEQGVPNLLGCTGFLASLKYINHFTTRACHKHVRALQEKLLISLLESDTWENEAERLLELHREHRLGSVLSFFTGHRTGFTTQLLEQGLKKELHASTREGYLRIALHGWHDSSDIRTLHSWLTSQS